MDVCIYGLGYGGKIDKQHICHFLETSDKNNKDCSIKEELLLLFSYLPDTSLLDRTFVAAFLLHTLRAKSPGR